MKKYIKPNTEVINVKLQQMIAGSLPLSDTEITGQGEILAPENNQLDFEDVFSFDDNNLVDF